MSVWQNLKDAFVLSAMHSSWGGGGIARGIYRLKGYSNDQINRAIDAETQEINARHRNDKGFVNGATNLVGSIAGGVDPTYAIGGYGKTLGRRMLAQGITQGVASVGRQATDRGTGMRTAPISAHQALDDAENGMLFQAGGEAAGKVAGAVVRGAKRLGTKAIEAIDQKISGPYRPADEVVPTPVVTPNGPDGLPTNGSVRPIDPREISHIMGDPDASGASGVNDNFPSRRLNDRDLSHVSEDDLRKLPPANREYVEQQLAQTPPEVDPTDYRNDNEPIQSEAPAPVQEAPAEPQIASPAVPQYFHNDELTPAENQEHDAAVPRPDVYDSMPEQPYVNNIADQGPPQYLNDNGLEPVIPERPLGQRDQAEADQNALHNGDEFGPAAGRQHKNFTEIPTDDPQGNKYLNYRASNGETVPIKMGIEPDGTAEIAIDQFSTKANRLGPREIRSAMYDLMDMYPEIKRFGGYRRSGAGKGRVQEIEPAPRPEPQEKEAPSTLADNVTDEGVKQEGRSIWSDERGSFTPWGRRPKKPKLEDIPEEDLTPEQRVMLGIRAADPVREAQEAGYRVDRAKRFEAAKNVQHVASGEEGFHQELKNLEGPMEQLPSPYSIRPNLNQEEVNSLFNQIRDHPALSYTDSLHGRTGLRKLLANSGESVPTRSELEILRKVFPEDPKAPKKSISGWITDVINAPRSIMASMDLSAPLRQGLPMIHRKEYWTSFASMFKQIGPEGFDAVKQEIAARPSYHTMKDSGLALTDIDDENLSHHEERFLSGLATHIPLFGHVVKASERAYVGFLNKLRADTWDTLVNNARAAGKKLGPKELRDISEYINTATGRGDLNVIPKFIRGEFDVNKAAPLVAGVLFSPRLMASRFQMLVNPNYYRKLSPIARHEAYKSLASTVTFTTTSLALAHMAGLKVGYDPRSTDFGKIRIGHTTYDMTGGFSSYARLVAQEIFNTRVNPDGTKTKLNRLDTLGSFLHNKESPPLSQAHSMLKGVDNDFNKVDRKHLGNVLEDMGKDFVPLVAQDTYGVYEDASHHGKNKAAGIAKAAASAVPDTFGIGVNTYEPKKAASRKTKFGDFGNGFGNGFKGGF
jgi:hypothetical protein